MTTKEAIEVLEAGRKSYYGMVVEAFDMAVAALRAQADAEKNPGEVSDGYHTFNELYHHRAVLFSVICNQHPERAWKSKKHYDGTMYGGMFVVGIDTPEGAATYHYDIDPYWDIFHVPEVKNAPEWDGHTPAEAIRRIGTLAEVEQSAALKSEELRGTSKDGVSYSVQYETPPVYLNAETSGYGSVIFDDDGNPQIMIPEEYVKTWLGYQKGGG